jgi:uncharacterized protein YciI
LNTIKDNPSEDRPARPARPRYTRPATKTFSGPVYVQVHFSGLPGATKKHLHAIKREITEKVQDMTRRGQLVISGRYLSSIGGVWLLKVKHIEEAQRLAKEHPAVKSNLLTFRVNLMVDTMGMVTRREVDHKPADTIEA